MSQQKAKNKYLLIKSETTMQKLIEKLKLYITKQTDRKYDDVLRWLITKEYDIYEKTVDFGDLHVVCLRCGNDSTKVYITVGDPAKTVSLDYWHTDDPYLFNYIVNVRCSGNPKIVSASHLNRKLWVELGDSYRDEIKEAEKEWAGEVVAWLDKNCEDEEFVKEIKEEYNKLTYSHG